MIGKRLGSCEILEKLGQGGMGEVYRARDTRLGREVALKLLSPEFARDPERIARFGREARTLASLHHPNIASLFGFEDADGYSFLLMELVEGEDLAERIDRGPIPAEEAGEIARQIALGMAAAHEKNIVHRDLKPSNIRITPDGEVKILDFGLARAFVDDDTDDQDLATSPTITAAMTRQGVILGSAAYMSPEQARGHTADTRSDIWSFGVILWEMLSGHRLFEGQTMSDTLANVLKQEVDLARLPQETPYGFRKVIARCLERDSRERLQSVVDARISLEDDSPEPAAAAQGPTRRLPWLLVVLLALLAGFLALRGTNDTGGSLSKSLALDIAVPEDSPVLLGDWPSIAISPDGGWIALTASDHGRAKLLLRPIEEREFRQPPRTTTQSLGAFFSPDSRWVGFFESGAIQKINVEGGSPMRIAAMSYHRGMSWSDDGYIYFAPTYSSGIHRALESGKGEMEAVTVLDSTRNDRTHRWPCALPGGRGVVFTAQTSDSPGDYENARIEFWDARSGEVRDLEITGAMAKYSRTGHLIVGREGTLNAYEFDLDEGRVGSGPWPVLDKVARDASSGMYYFDLTDESDILYIEARETTARRQLVWIDREGNAEPFDMPRGPYRYPRLSPDGTKIALVMGNGHGGEDDIYLVNADGKHLTRFSFNRTSIMPLWDPDGQSVIYLSVQDGGTVQRRPVNSSAPGKRIIENMDLAIPASITSDGERMFFTLLGGPRLGALTTLKIGDPPPTETVLDGRAAEWAPVISPDSRWLAYVSDETGREEIYVQPWPLTGAKWQISNGGGRSPRWARDGSELFFTLGDGLYSARIDTTNGFSANVPELLFRHPIDTSNVPMANYDVSPDGKRFLMVEADVSAVASTLKINIGWAQKLEGTREP